MHLDLNIPRRVPKSSMLEQWYRKIYQEEVTLSESDVKQVQRVYLGSTGEEEVSMMKCPSYVRETGMDAYLVKLSHRDQ